VKFLQESLSHLEFVARLKRRILEGLDCYTLNSVKRTSPTDNVVTAAKGGHGQAKNERVKNSHRRKVSQSR